MWTFYILQRTKGFSRRLNESSKSMIDWQYLSFSFEQGDDSLNENLLEESFTNGHVSDHVMNWWICRESFFVYIGVFEGDNRHM